MAALDRITLVLDPAAQNVLGVLLALIMFSVALGLSMADFRQVARRPGVIAYGLGLQMVMLPAMTFVVSGWLAATPSIALGMMVVAACPGGNVSNFFTLNAKGDAALSVSLTAFSSVLCTFTTPFNIILWASLHPQTRSLLAEIGVDRSAFILQTFLLLGLPLAAGMLVSARAPSWARRLRGPCRTLAFLALVVFVVGAVVANRDHLGAFGWLVLPAAAAHNALALGLGYGAARIAGLPAPTRRAFTFEIGIQNTGLGLVILLEHFQGLGGAALMTAAWGVWHFVSGTSLVALWARRPPKL